MCFRNIGEDNFEYPRFPVKQVVLPKEEKEALSKVLQLDQDQQLAYLLNTVPLVHKVSKRTDQCNMKVVESANLIQSLADENKKMANQLTEILSELTIFRRDFAEQRVEQQDNSPSKNCQVVKLPELPFTTMEDAEEYFNESNPVFQKQQRHLETW